MTDLLPADPDGIAQAAALLRAGALVAFATETVYGLGGDATDATAVAAIFAAKDRPRFNPLICHYPTPEAAFADVAPNDLAHALAAAFWPGPLTLILPRRPHSRVAHLTGAGLDTLAVRIPAHPVALALLAALGRPVAAPSANRSGRVSPTTAAHALEELGGRISAVLDGGPCGVGVESTVLDLSGPTPVLLRPGGLTLEALVAVIGPIGHAPHVPADHVPADHFPADHFPADHFPADHLPAGHLPAAASSAATAATPRSPGQLASHYAPRLPVRLQAEAATPDEALLAFGPPDDAHRTAGATFQLSAAGDTAEAAARLFDGLRRLDAEGARLGLRGIAAMRVPAEGLGHAINDRLRRAAAPRPRDGTPEGPAVATEKFTGK